MKKAYTNETITTTVKALDVRAQKFSTDQINNVIDDAYSELCTIVQAFSDEEVVELDSFYEAGELQITLDIEEDVVEIYDLYLTKENLDKTVYDYGIEQTRSEKLIYRDNRYNGRVHVDLDANAQSTLPNSNYDNAIIKYYYIPTSTTEVVYMDAQTWIAFKSALGVALYDEVHDVERNGQKRAEMARRAKAIIPSMPEDAKQPALGHIFFGTEF